MAFLGIILLPLLHSTTGQVLQNAFHLQPQNKSFFYDSSKRMEQFCIPPIGDPEPTVVWHKDGKLLKSNDRIRMTSTTNTTKIYRLIIDPVIGPDHGTYQCVATNEAGKKERTFFVRVSDKCKGDAFKCPEDKICIIRSGVCDGNSNCQNAIDESVNAGCSLPPPPSYLYVDEKAWNRITVKWIQPTEKILSYDMTVQYPNGSHSFFSIKPEMTVFTLNHLISKMMYKFKVRVNTWTGPSNFSNTVTVKTRSKGVPKAPQNFHCKQKDINYITMKWENSLDAVSYDVVMVGPAKQNFIAFPALPEVTATELQDNTTYAFKVRARSAFGHSVYSDMVSIKTLPLGSPGPPEDVRSTVEKLNVTIRWNRPAILANSKARDLLYQVKYCEMLPYFRSERVNKTVRRFVKHNTTSMSNGSKLLFVDPANKTGVYQNVTKLTYMEMLYYNKTNCLESTTRYKEFKAYNLKEVTVYWFEITTFGYRSMKGGSIEGNFTIVMSTTVAPSTKPASPEKGYDQLIVFGAVSGGLIVILIVAFIFAYCCKWKFLMDAVEEQRIQKKRNEKSVKDADSANSRLLLGNYDNMLT